MADWLLLRLPRNPEQPATWLVADARGVAQGPPQSGPLSLAAPRVAGRRVGVLVPGTDVLVAEPELPTKAGAKLQQLVPYALEEQLADDIDDLHFAIGKRQGDSPRTPVAVVTRALMDEWLTSLKSNGIEPEVMYADSDLLPQNPGQSVALLEEDVIIVRPPGASPVTLPADALHEALELAQAGSTESGGAGRGLILYTGHAEWQQYSQQVEALRERFDGIKIQLLANGPLALFAQQLPNATPVNLLQGAYTPTTSRAVGFRAWRVAAILLVSLVGLHVAGKAAELTLLKRSEHKLDVAIREALQSAMPGESNNPDARRIMERRLAAARAASSGGLLPALEALVRARGVAPSATLKALNFHDGSIDLQINAPDAASLDRIGQALRNNGWRAELTSGSNVGNGYEGRLQLQSN
ncbi:MAG TPA: type II secretion system protein GspL [Steroidobacteraceae bacterium]|nr:type II secretion system protein GspL [Steroidobacteraceae bacterium]